MAGEGLPDNSSGAAGERPQHSLPQGSGVEGAQGLLHAHAVDFKRWLLQYVFPIYAMIFFFCIAAFSHCEKVGR